MRVGVTYLLCCCMESNEIIDDIVDLIRFRKFQEKKVLHKIKDENKEENNINRKS